MQPQDIDNRELLLLLRQHSSGRASQPQVAEALRKATLLLAAEQDEQQGDEDLASLVEPSRRVTILESERGETAVAAFTHEGALREWAPMGSRYVGMSGRDVFALARDRRLSKVLINPGSPEGIQIGGGGIEALAEGG